MDNLYTQWPAQLLSDERPSTSTVNGAESSSSSSSLAMDMSDFPLADMAVQSTSTTNSQQFFSYPAHNYLNFSPFNTMAYGSSSWPATTTTTTTTQSHVPLSNYSSLNGATTSATPPSTLASASSQPQQHSPPQSKQPSQTPSQLHQAMIIDPSLATLNGTSRTTTTAAPNMQHYPHANYNAQSSALQPQPSSSSSASALSQQPQFTYSQLFPSLYRAPASYYQSQQQQQQQQQQQAPQGTLSPQALHAPTSSILSALMPSGFYTQSTSSLTPSSSQQQQQQPLHPEPIPPPPPLKTPAELKSDFLSKLRPQLQPTSFSGAGAVNLLADTLRDYGATDVDAYTRLEILTKMRDGAGNHYFRAWSENGSAMTITREWLKAAQMADVESPLVETIMPLLHIIDRLPMTLDTLKASKLGKIVVKLVKEPRSPAIKDMASNVERKWRSLINNVDSLSSKSTADNNNEDLKAKNLKRKVAIDSQTSSSSRTVPKKGGGTIAASSSSSKLMAVKKEPGLSTSTTSTAPKPAAKDAKSDSSFFSAPKPKPKLPSFKKAPPAPPLSASASTSTNARTGAGTPSNVAQPSSVNPFEEALKSMGRSTKRESPAVNTPPSIETQQPQYQGQSNGSGLTKKGTKKKTVTWAPPGMLERIKLIERAVYDDDPVDGNHTTHTLKDLDRGEGAALHAQIFEETLDWSDPILIDNPVVEEDRPRGSGSLEKDVQEKREQTTLGALYISPAHVPDSPAEPPHVISEAETDRTMVAMTSGPEADAVFWSSGPVSPVAQSVAELVGQLASGASTDPALSAAQFNGQGLDLAAVGLDATSTLAAVQALPQEQIQRLLQQLQPLQQQQQQTQFPQTGQQQQQQQSSTQATGGQQPLITIRIMDNSSSNRFRIIIKTKMLHRIRDGEDVGGEEDEGGAEAGVITGIETIQDDYLALFSRQEGERILQ
ncbi:hypothetical protein C0995_007931 [Termitomyces sp. Mi166|nr:hypothetical protein C0995_007931 [Termitomyces sp. Mi166\